MKKLRILSSLIIVILLCFLWPISSFSEDSCRKTVQSTVVGLAGEVRQTTIVPKGEKTSSAQTQKMGLDTPLNQVDFDLTAEEQALFKKFLEDKNIKTVRNLKDKTTKPYLRVFLSREVVYKVMSGMWYQFHVVISEF